MGGASMQIAFEFDSPERVRYVCYLLKYTRTLIT